MELPSIKLNIFKKLEYFLVLQKLNLQFDAQFKVLMSKKSNGSHPCWEIEKKILFWTYLNHKHLRSNIFPNKIQEQAMRGMFLSEWEVGITGINKILGNLAQRGFMETESLIRPDGREIITKCTITQKGLAFGELLWFLYLPKNNKSKTNSTQFREYLRQYRTNYGLNRKSLGYFLLWGQLFSVYIFTVYAVIFFTVEILDKIGLLDNLKNWSFNIEDNIIIWLILFPAILFIVSFGGEKFYQWIVVNRKYKKIEKIKTADIQNLEQVRQMKSNYKMEWFFIFLMLVLLPIIFVHRIPLFLGLLYYIFIFFIFSIWVIFIEFKNKKNTKILEAIYILSAIIILFTSVFVVLNNKISSESNMKSFLCQEYEINLDVAGENIKSLGLDERFIIPTNELADMCDINNEDVFISVTIGDLVEMGMGGEKINKITSSANNVYNLYGGVCYGVNDYGQNEKDIKDIISRSFMSRVPDEYFKTHALNKYFQDHLGLFPDQMRNNLILDFRRLEISNNKLERVNNFNNFSVAFEREDICSASIGEFINKAIDTKNWLSGGAGRVEERLCARLDDLYCGTKNKKCEKYQ